MRKLLGRNVNQFRYESVHLARLGVEEMVEEVVQRARGSRR